MTIDGLLIEDEAREYAAAYGVYTSGFRTPKPKKTERIEIQRRASEKLALQTGSVKACKPY